jgi:hypothetical protein
MVEAFLLACENPKTASNYLKQGLSIVAVLEALNKSMRSNGSSISVDRAPVEEFAKSL